MNDEQQFLMNDYTRGFRRDVALQRLDCGQEI